MEGAYYKIMFGLIKKIFIGLLNDLINGPNPTKCVSLSHQKYMIQPTLINLHHNEYNQKFHYYPFTVKLNRCVGSCNTLHDLSNKDLNLSVFSINTGIYESEKLIKHISCERKRRLDGKNVIQINGGIMINVDLSVKNIMYVKKIIFGIQFHVIMKMENI